MIKPGAVEHDGDQEGCNGLSRARPKCAGTWSDRRGPVRHLLNHVRWERNHHSSRAKHGTDRLANCRNPGIAEGHASRDRKRKCDRRIEEGRAEVSECADEDRCRQPVRKRRADRVIRTGHRQGANTDEDQCEGPDNLDRECNPHVPSDCIARDCRLLAFNRILLGSGGHGDPGRSWHGSFS